MKYVILAYHKIAVKAGDENPVRTVVGLGHNLDDAVEKAQNEYQKRCDEEDFEAENLMFAWDDDNVWYATDKQYGRTWALVSLASENDLV